VTGHELAEMFRGLEARIAAEKGDFVLFALFLREDADVWDLLVAAPWLGDNQMAATTYIADQIRAHLGADVLLNLSTIVIADPHYASVEAMNRKMPVEHGEIELRDRVLFGQPVKHAFIITSKLPAASATA
jgi:hypothetical protein